MAKLLRGLMSGGKVLGGTMLGGIGGTLPFLLMDMFGNTEQESPPTDLGSGDGGDMMALLGMLQQQAGSNRSDLRNELARSEGLLSMLDTSDLAGRRASSLGVADDLETIIRGNEDLLGKIAYSEPLSLAQAYAMKGLYAPPMQPEFSFRGLM